MEIRIKDYLISVLSPNIPYHIISNASAF